MESRGDVAVGVEGERDRAVAEEFLDHLRMNAASQQMGRGRVPEVMQPEAWQACRFERAVKPLDCPGAIDWTTHRCCENQAAVAPLRSCRELVLALTPTVLCQRG